MYEQKLAIRYWAEDDRPREKMMLKGKNALSDAELIAILIGTGSGSKSAVDLGRELLALSNGDLHDFGKLRLVDLQKVKGIGASKAISILAALELGRRRKENEPIKKLQINSAKTAFDLLLPYYIDLTHEEFYVIYLNRSNHALKITQISVGGTSGTYVEPRMIYKFAIEYQATALILSHNHPSGTLRPSVQDIELTKRIKKLGELIEIPVLDHVIITDNGYFSFNESKLL
jgi:DNA repair protein RadC